ncbi:FtsX-like permease family protein, partial [bacterium]
MVAPRLWMYNIHLGNLPGDFRDPYARGLLNLTSMRGWRTEGGILGISSEELDVVYSGNITTIDKILLDGVWFPSEEDLFCIISENYASFLNISMSDPSSTLVKVNGFEMRVCGIYDSGLLEQVKDLNGRTLVPQDPSELRGRKSLYGFEVILMPFEAVMKRLIDYSPLIMQVAIAVDDPVKVREIGEALTTYYDFDVYVSTGNRVYFYAHGISREVSGIQFIIMPAVIGVVTMLNIMLGNVVERTREISTFASVGLSPLHVASMFLAEAGIYAVLGGTLGYLAGIVLASAAYILFGIAVNYSSLMVVAVVLLSMALTTASTIYPMYKSTKLVTPSLERRWKVPTKPKGDNWEIPLPFVSSEAEAEGILTFLKE